MTEVHVMPNTGWIKHGHCTNGIISSTYHIWASMIKRCTNQNCKAYKDYGGRGITVCRAWFTFENFLEDMGERPIGLQLERRNNELGYCNQNCYWATRKQQARNKRNTRIFTAFGVTGTLPELCEQFGVCNRMVGERMRRYGWTIEQSLTTKNRVHKHDTRHHTTFTALGVSGSLSSLAKHFAQNPKTVYKRLNYGWTIEKALTHQVE